MATTPESELTTLLAATDDVEREAAWAAFLAAYGRLLLHVARSTASQHDDAMDLYAHLLGQLRADDFRRLRAYAPAGPGKLSTWLVVVARRLCLDWHRMRHGRRRIDEGGATGNRSGHALRAVRRRLAALTGVDPEAEQLPSEDSPEEALRTSELRRVLGVVLAELDPSDRLLLTLRHEHGLSATDIARMLGFATPFHVYRRLTRLHVELRWRLARHGVVDPAP